MLQLFSWGCQVRSEDLWVKLIKMIHRVHFVCLRNNFYELLVWKQKCKLRIELICSFFDSWNSSLQTWTLISDLSTVPIHPNLRCFKLTSKFLGIHFYFTFLYQIRHKFGLINAENYLTPLIPLIIHNLVQFS